MKHIHTFESFLLEDKAERLTINADLWNGRTAEIVNDTTALDKKRIAEELKKILLPKRLDSFLEFLIENGIEAKDGGFEIKITAWDQIGSYSESTLFDKIIPMLNKINQNLKCTFVTANSYRDKPGEPIVIYLKPSKFNPLSIDKGYHYVHSSKLNSVKENGLKPQPPSLHWSTNPFTGDFQMGLWPDKRTYFFVERDDEDAKMTFGEEMIPLEIDLQGIKTFEDTDYIGDGIVAVWTKQPISLDRIRFI